MLAVGSDSVVMLAAFYAPRLHCRMLVLPVLPPPEEGLPQGLRKRGPPSGGGNMSRLGGIPSFPVLGRGRALNEPGGTGCRYGVCCRGQYSAASLAAD